MSTREFALSKIHANTLHKNPTFSSSAPRNISKYREIMHFFRVYFSFYSMFYQGTNRKLSNECGKKSELLEGSNELKLFFGLHIIVT